QAEDGIRDFHVTGVQTCALPISEDDGRDRGDREPARGGCVMSVELGAWLHEAAERMDEACVRCGRCFEVCPVTPWSAAKGADPRSEERRVGKGCRSRGEPALIEK